MQYGNIIPPIYPTGVFIQSIEQTKASDESGGDNVFTVTLTNHTQQQFVVKNGKRGSACESINEIRASVDNSVGTPTVEVVETDAGAKKNVSFIFKNLKGETGNVALTEEVKQHISQSVASANQYTDDAIKGVSQSIDTGDTNTLQAAKKYADQNVQAETQARATGDMDMLADAKRYINDLLIKIFQNGYIQWPGMPTPDTLFTFEGYRWAEVNYDGCFFRAKGKDANPFNGGEQGDAIRNIKGLVGIEGGSNPSGPFYIESPSPKNVESWHTSVHEYTVNSTCFDASRIVPTAEENRTRNRTFIIWKLEKIEG
jgi:similarities with bacteriophage protein|nr:MAG TPA: short tail fiber protein [Caudoviricetes sp.]